MAGSATLSPPPPRPGPAGSAPTTAPHRRSQEAGRRLRRPPVRPLPSSRPASAASTPRPAASSCPEPWQHSSSGEDDRGAGGGGNGGGMCCRLRGGRLPRSEGPALRPRPSPPARLADWPAWLRRAWPIKRGDGEAGAEAQKERGRESLGQERLGAEGPGAGRSLARRKKPEEAGERRGRQGAGSPGSSRPVCAVRGRGGLGCWDSGLRSFLVRCYLSASFTLESREVCPSSTRAPKQTLSPVLGRPRAGASGLGLTRVTCILKAGGTEEGKGPLTMCPQQVETWKDLILP